MLKTLITAALTVLVLLAVWQAARFVRTCRALDAFSVELSDE